MMKIAAVWTLVLLFTLAPLVIGIAEQVTPQQLAEQRVSAAAPNAGPCPPGQLCQGVVVDDGSPF